MFRCPDCDYTAETREKFAGHRSGHVRRRELRRRELVLKEHRCKHCGLCFESGQHLAGHLASHRPKRPVNWETCNNSRRKSLLLEECGHRCKICSLTEWMGKPIPIELDHIDGNNEHNAKANLRLLCQIVMLKRRPTRVGTSESMTRKVHCTEECITHDLSTRSLVARQPDFNPSLQGFEPPRVHNTPR